MRFKSTLVDGFRAFAVTGTNTISFAITATAAAKRGLLGFAVRRSEAGEEPRKMPGFKVFRSVVPKPDRNTRVSTWDHPVQSFVWDDFTAKPDEKYEYWFHPLRGTPRRLDRSAPAIRIPVRTEKLYGDEHDVFFNRGAASSQLYARRFGNKRPSQLPAAQAAAALQWLTRDLDEAIVKFIESAGRGDDMRHRVARVVQELRDLAQDISAPVLAIQGTADPYGTVLHVEAVRDGSSGPVELLLLDCAHAPHLEAAEPVPAAVVRFLASLPNCAG